MSPAVHAGVRNDRRVLEAESPPFSQLPAIQHRLAGFHSAAEGRWRDAAVALSQSSNEAFLRHCSPCGAFYAAQMWDAAGAADSAIAYYRRGADRPALSYDREDALLYPVALRRLGDLYEQRGNRAAALDWYGRFVDLWRDADPDLQPLVRDVRGHIARLIAEPGAR